MEWLTQSRLLTVTLEQTVCTLVLFGALMSALCHGDRPFPLGLAVCLLSQCPQLTANKLLPPEGTWNYLAFSASGHVPVNILPPRRDFGELLASCIRLAGTDFVFFQIPTFYYPYTM